MKILKVGRPLIIEEAEKKIRQKKNKTTCCCWEGDKVVCLLCECQLKLTIADPIGRYGGAPYGHYLHCPGCGNPIHIHCKEFPCCQEKKRGKK